MTEKKLDDESLKAWVEYFKLLAEIEQSVKSTESSEA